MLYVTGFQTLRRNGALDVFIATHHLSDSPLAFADVHFTAQFFAWHSYFLSELETAIRLLGGAYECFALPFWDFTVDAAAFELSGDANAIPIYNSVLGADGDSEDDFCVADALWSRDAYSTTFLCSEKEIAMGRSRRCCLKRHKGERGHIPSASAMLSTFAFRRWRDFQDGVLLQHTFVHAFVSGNDNKTHMFGHNAAEDPLFVLLHNFLFYIRALRTNCLGYDKSINELEQFAPFAYDPFQNDRAADMKPFL